ncbi:serine protease FAM111A-like [Pholidichthys leucotaenia]
MTSQGLLDILDNLEKDDFDRFKFYLANIEIPGRPALKRGQLDGLNRQRTVNLMVMKYENAGAVEVTKEVLKNMSQMMLLQELSKLEGGSSNTETQSHPQTVTIQGGMQMDISSLHEAHPHGQSTPGTSNASANTKEISEIMHQQLTNLKDWMEKNFPGDSYQKALELKKENFGKIEQSFSEVHRVRELIQLSESVCLLEIRVSSTSSVQGTGFVLFDKFVMTNAHLFVNWINSQISNWWEDVEVTAVFNYEKHDSDKKMFKARVRVGQRHLDYVLLELLEGQNPEPPGLLKRFGPVPPDGAACIIGHPKGEVKKLDPTCIIEKDKRGQAVDENLHEYRDNILTLCSIRQTIKDDPYADVHVTYNTFMYHGSSGSPVFDAHGQVFGLHSGGFFFGFPKPSHSVIEYSFPLLRIFKELVTSLQEVGDSDLLGKVLDEAEGNPHLKAIIDTVPGLKQFRSKNM